MTIQPTSDSGARGGDFVRRSTRGFVRGDGLAVAAVALLAVASAAIAPSSLSLSALMAMLPFAAILGIAAIGQQFVIQQGGFDLSVGGSISLVCVIATYGPPDSAPVAAVLLQFGLAVVVAMAFGAANGFLIVKLRILPLVTTIGMNAILMGFVLWLSEGTPGSAPAVLDRFALGRICGLPNVVLVAIFATALAAVGLGCTVAGRRFVLTGANRSAARAAGISTVRYEIGAYVAASVFYGVAGVMLTGLLKVPSLAVGQAYLLATVAAVVIGGNSLLGGKASPLATVVGAVFMTQLGQMLVAAGLDRSVQYLLQGAIVIVGASVHVLIPRWTAAP